MGAGIAARLFMQDDVAAIGLEIRPERREETMGILAQIEIGRIALIVLAPVQPDVVIFLIGLADRNVADLLKTEIDRIALPDSHALTQNRMQGTGHVEIADTAAGKTRGARTRPLLCRSERHRCPCLSRSAPAAIARCQAVDMPCTPAPTTTNRPDAGSVDTSNSGMTAGLAAA